MKKQVLTALALMSVAAASCKVDSYVAPAPVFGEEFIISADCGNPDTRMERDGAGKMYWSPGDEIGVFMVQGTSILDRNERFAAMLDAPSCSTQFRAVVPGGWEPAEYYAKLNELWGNEELEHVAIYPYSSSTNGGCYSDKFTFLVQLPNVQQGIPGTFDPACWVALARSRNDHFTFAYPYGGIKFSVVSENVSKVTITCGEEYKYDNFGGKKEYVSIHNDGSVSVTSSSTASDPFYQSLELVPQGGTFVPGEAYYFVIPPTSLDKGISFHFEKADGSVAKRTVTPPKNQWLSIKSGVFKTLMEADSGCEWKEPAPDVTPTSISITKFGGEASFDVKCGKDYTVTCAEDWLVDMGGEGDAVADKCTHTFVVKRNYGAARTATINVASDGGTTSVTVSQAAGEQLPDYPSIVRRHLILATMSTSCNSGANPFPLKEAKEEHGDLFEYVTIFDDSSNVGNECYTEHTQYKITYPDYFYFFDGRRQVKGRMNMIPVFAAESDDVYPTQTSIGMSSSVDGKTLTVDLSVYAYTAQYYKIAVYVAVNVKYVSGRNATPFNHYNVTQYKMTEDNGSVAGKQYQLSKGLNNIQLTRELPVAVNGADYSILAYVLAPFDQQPVIRDGDYRGGYYVDNCRLVPVGSSVTPEVVE